MNSALLRRRKSLKDDALAVMRAAAADGCMCERARGPLRGRAWNCVEKVETRSVGRSLIERIERKPT